MDRLKNHARSFLKESATLTGLTKGVACARERRRGLTAELGSSLQPEGKVPPKHHEKEEEEEEVLETAPDKSDTDQHDEQRTEEKGKRRRERRKKGKKKE